MTAPLDLGGARTVLTGASSGIGHALALRLADQKARLVLAARSTERLEALAATIRQRGGQAIAVPTDVTDPAQRRRLIDAALEHHGGIDIFINNAGVGAMGWFLDAGEERLRQIFEVNFFAATELTRLALPHLLKGNNPMLVNVSSIIGRRGIPGCTEYCASKFALSGWTEGLRAELLPHGAHVLLVCPGAIATEFRSNMVEDKLKFAWQTRERQSADQCAKLMVRAMRKRKNELLTTGEGKLLVYLNRLFPRLVDWLLPRFSRPL